MAIAEPPSAPAGAINVETRDLIFSGTGGIIISAKAPTRTRTGAAPSAAQLGEAGRRIGLIERDEIKRGEAEVAALACPFGTGIKAGNAERRGNLDPAHSRDRLFADQLQSGQDVGPQAARGKDEGFNLTRPRLGGVGA